MLKKNIFIQALLLISFTGCFAQTVNVLNLKNKKYYLEKNKFLGTDTLKLTQEVSYDKPNVVDEGYSLILNIDILPSKYLQAQQVLNLAKDSQFIKCSFDLLSVWNWETEKTSISGNLQIIAQTQTRIVLDLDIEVLNLITNKTYLYKGRRSFVKNRS